MLTFAHGHRPDDQWLYLPTLKRVKRIASRNKSGPFMGSEFAYEDLGSQELDKYRYRYLRQEPRGERTCDVLDRIPVSVGWAMAGNGCGSTRRPSGSPASTITIAAMPSSRPWR